MVLKTISVFGNCTDNLICPCLVKWWLQYIYIILYFTIGALNLWQLLLSCTLLHFLSVFVFSELYLYRQLLLYLVKWWLWALAADENANMLIVNFPDPIIIISSHRFTTIVNVVIVVDTDIIKLISIITKGSSEASGVSGAHKTQWEPLEPLQPWEPDSPGARHTWY